MTRKIINIVVFTVAIVGGILGVVYAGLFDDEKINQYKAVGVLQDENPAMLDELETVTIESLPKYVETYQNTYNTLDDQLRAEKKSKESFYYYLSTLKSINAEDFADFKAGYPNNLKELLDEFDSTKTYQTEFDKIATYEDLTAYLLPLEENYNEVRQNYLKKEAYRNALKSCLDGAVVITEVNSVDKKTNDLAQYQKDVSNFQLLNAKLLNPAFIFFYVLLAFTVIVLLVFAVINIVANFKTAYKGLLGALAIVVVFVISYLIASPDRSDVLMKLQITPETARLIEAGCYTLYAVFVVAVLSIIVMPFIKIKKI